MNLDISAKTEARLAARAQESGLSIDALLERLLSDAVDLTADTASGEIRELPVWNLGVRGVSRKAARTQRTPVKPRVSVSRRFEAGDVCLRCGAAASR